MRFIKTTFALTGVMAAMTFAPEASAIPAFARQVGMACSACHYQHFPALNSFGRSFKQSGYTMVGAQDKIEGDGVSLPVVLNAALVSQIAYTKTNGPVPTITVVQGKKTSNDGQTQIPAADSLFLGGRGGEHLGFEAEIQLGSAGTATATTGLIRLKAPVVGEVGGLKVGLVPFSTNGLGVADSFEVLNTGAVAVHAFNQADMPAISAQQYVNTGQPAHGVALVVSNEDFFMNASKWGASQGDGTAGAPTSNYLRAAWTSVPVIPGFDTAIGFQSWSGASSTTTNGAYVTGGGTAWSPILQNNGIAYNGAITAGSYSTNAGAIDAQTMGDVGGMPLLVIASYAKAPKSPYTNGVATDRTNLFNQGTFDRTSFNLGAELGVVPGKATLQVGYRRGQSGIDAATVGGAAGKNATDNAFLLGATYSIALNARVNLTYSKYSGDLYGAGAANAAATSTTNGTTVTYLGDSRVMADVTFGF